MILAVDPGLNGAYALFDPADGSALVDSLPILGKLVEVLALREALLSYLLEPLTVVIEQQQAYPRQGIASAFLTGRNYGRLEGLLLELCASYEGSYHPVRPSAWKRALRLSQDKEASRQRALELFPALAPQLRRKKDEGRAEALCLGYWWLHQGDK